jgi:hypothetical protein
MTFLRERLIPMPRNGVAMNFQWQQWIRMILNPEASETLFAACQVAKIAVSSTSQSLDIAPETAHIGIGGGQQLGAFIAGTGDSQKGRTCNGRLQDGDTYKVEFNYDGADKK